MTVAIRALRQVPAAAAGGPAPRLSGSVRYLAYAAGAIAAVVALQALPAFAADAWGVGHELVVLVAATVTSVQVGQTVGIQNLLRGRLPAGAGRAGAGLAVLAGGAALLVPTGMVALIGAGVLGGVLGTATAARTADLLAPGRRTAYQRASCLRNLAWLAALAAVGVAGQLSVRSFLVLTVVAWLLADRVEQATRTPGPPLLQLVSAGAATSPATARLLTLVIGFGAALLYRNDVNVVRLAVAGSASFETLHYVLLAHAFVVATVGFLTGQLVYPALRGIDDVPARLVRRLRLGFVGVVVVGTSLGVAGVLVGLPEAGLLAAGTLVAAWNPLASALLHATGRSLWVYVPLVACFGGLALAAPAQPALAFTVYNAAAGLVLLTGISIAARRTEDREVKRQTSTAGDALATMGGARQAATATDATAMSSPCGLAGRALTAEARR